MLIAFNARAQKALDNFYEKYYMMNRTSNLIGILGGMGPIASAEFIRTIYECCAISLLEQEKPQIILM